MCYSIDDLWRYIELIRSSSPKTPDERIAYIKDVNACHSAINDLYVTENDYMVSLLKSCSNKDNELIIGKVYSKSLNNSQCRIAKETYSNKCVICGFSVNSILEVHHIIPKNLCGKNEISNLAVVCPTCHVIFHDIEQNECITEELKDYLIKNNQLDAIVEYTKHLIV